MNSLSAKWWRDDGEFSRKATSITIAHRLSMVADADMILGEVVQMGSHEMLVSASGGLYSRMYHMQMKGAKD